MTVGSIQIPRLATPSRKSGFARSKAEALHPELWDGLVGAWSPKLGPTGLDLFDVSGNKNDGILANMDPATAWQVGEKGWGLEFDGVNQRVSVSNSPEIDFSTESFSFGLFARINGNTGADCLVGKGNPVGGTGWGLYYTGSVLRPFIRDGVNIEFFDTSAVSTGENRLWIVVIDRGNDTMTVYQDGVDIGSGDISSVGSLSTSTSYNIASAASDPRYSKITCHSDYVYCRVLSPSEISLLASDPDAMFRRRPLTIPVSSGVAAAAIMNQLQGSNLGADLYNGALL